MKALEEMTVVELKDELEKLDLSTKGNKATLVTRLESWLKTSEPVAEVKVEAPVVKPKKGNTPAGLEDRIAKMCSTDTIVQLKNGSRRRITTPINKGGRHLATVSFGGEIDFFWNDRV